MFSASKEPPKKQPLSGANKKEKRAAKCSYIFEFERTCNGMKKWPLYFCSFSYQLAPTSLHISNEDDKISSI